MVSRLDRIAARGCFGVATASVIVFMSACGTMEEAEMSQEDARAALVAVIEQTAEQLSVTGWAPDRSPEVGRCGARGDERVNYTYGYGAPAPQSDRGTDAHTIADYWRSLGMEVEVVQTPVYTVYGTGGSVEGLSFSTAPGDYYISGTSACVPGDLGELS